MSLREDASAATSYCIFQRGLHGTEKEPACLQPHASDIVYIRRVYLSSRTHLQQRLYQRLT